MKLYKLFEYFLRLIEFPTLIEIECLLVFGYLFKNRIHIWSLSSGAYELEYEYWLVLSFYHDGVNFSENKCLCFIFCNAFSYTNKGSVHFVNSFKARSGIYCITEGSIFDFLPLTSNISNNSRSFVDPHSHRYLKSKFCLESYI